MLLTFSLLLNAILVAGLLIAMNKMGGARYLLFKLRVGGGGGMGVGREEHLLALDGARQSGKIVFLGDSLTEAADVARCSVPAWSIAASPGTPRKGFSIGPRPSPRTRPAKVFLMAGINDLVSDDAPPVIQRCASRVATTRRWPG